MSNITAKELQLKLDSFMIEGKTKYKYIKAGTAFISENGTLTGIKLDSYVAHLIQDAKVKGLNTDKDGQIIFNVFDKNAQSNPNHAHSQNFKSDIPF